MAEVKVQGELVNDGDKAAQPETKAYKLVRGSHVGANIGDTVQLTKDQAASFADRFEPVDKDDDEPASRSRAAGKKGSGTEEPQELSDEDKAALARRPVPTSHTPQDIGAKTMDNPLAADTNPGNLVRHTRVAGKVDQAAMGDGDVQEGEIPPIRDNTVATNKTGGTPDPAVTQQPSEKKAAADKAAADKK
jgi:hypothetical protein